MTPRRDGYEEDDDPLSKEERWSQVYYAGRRDGANEALVNHRLTVVEEGVKSVRQDIHDSKKFLMTLAITAVVQLGGLLATLISYVFGK